MRAAVIWDKTRFTRKALTKSGIKIVKKDPDVVFSVGGDGTCLFSEQKYPGVPKVFIKHRDSCKKCKKHKINFIINALKNKKYKIIREMKIEVHVKGKKMIALNDINIHYKPPQALRFQVKVNNRLVARELIGDGVVISTPYGSSGYFYSITRKKFKSGIGIAFNNPVKRMKPKITNKNSKIEVKILRGDGFVAVDGIKRLIPIKKGSVIKIKKHNKPARFIKLRNKKVKLSV